MAITINHQHATRSNATPTVRNMNQWVRGALHARTVDTEITVRIVDARESRRLNLTWRGKDSATNVLAFPATVPVSLALPLLGDIVICAAVVNREAKAQGKLPAAHWAHMIVHGCLHLNGYDHVRTKDATIMENYERRILASLGFPDPYHCP